MTLWLDDIREAPEGCIDVCSVNQAIHKILEYWDQIDCLDLDHDLGDYAKDGGDAINLLDWCVENQFFPKVKLHTSNPVGRANMERLIARHWP